MMRIIYVNLHENGFFVTTIKSMLLFRHTVAKHAFILKWLLSNNIEVMNYITPGCSGLPTKFLRDLTKNSFMQKNIAKFVLKRNHIPVDKIKTITDYSEIKEKDIVIYYGTFDETQFETINEVKGIKIVDQIHFYGDKQKAELLRDKGIGYYMYEVDLQKYSKLFQKNYDWFEGKYIERPYAYEERFISTRSFNSRKNKAVAMGTLTKCMFPEFEETYGTIYYQPRRKLIMDHVQELEEYVDSYISEYQETPFKQISDKDFIAVKIYKKFYNAFNSGRQRKYYSFNMVDKYNEYKMFICPEDINGSYGIGTLEGMACGCAMIGWDQGMFEDMGMVSGRHYISYNGTLEDLKAKIRYYQMDEHQEELERIARTGCEYVRRNYSQEKVAERYYDNLKLVYEEHYKILKK